MPDLPNLANRDYERRINRAIDHVTGNLASSLKLDDVARVAGFSPHHFHRIFRAAMGETLANFVKRVRLERAVSLLSHQPDRSLTDIALATGFSSSSDFSRCFRAQYGVPPRAFDVKVFRQHGRERGLGSLEVPQPAGAPGDFEVTLQKLPKRRVAYVRAHRPYEGDGVKQAVARLLDWAEARGLADGQWLGYQWDDPDIVPLDKCRYDIGLELPDVAEVDEQISCTTFPAMTVAEIPIAGGVELELQALDWLYGVWLPTSGYVPDHQPGFEAFDGKPFEHGETYFELRIHLPVVDASSPL